MAQETLRQPIVTIMGHVDHGKTSLLDTIRHTTVTEREAGKITQAIGASIVPLQTINRICGKLLKKLGLDLTIPGLLFIDTPGHAAFSTLRKRGGSLADIAIVVVDIKEGFKPQTLEAIEILKSSKTPFILAANKVDLLPGWKKQSESILESINKQNPELVKVIETRLYEIVGKLHEMGYESERFDRIENYTKQIAIVPISAKTSEGLQELLMVLSGLTQRYMVDKLKCDVAKGARGSVLEVKEEPGLGKTADVIIYDGYIKVNDTIVIGDLNEPIVTRVRALLEPTPLSEMMDKKSKFKGVKQICAANGVKIAAPEMDNVIAGMPIWVVGKDDNLEELKKQIQEIIQEVIIETEKEGIIIKADAIGSLEAMISLLKDKKIPIRKAKVGNISKKDLIDAESNEKDPFSRVILGFNVEVMQDAQPYQEESKIKVITSQIIYKIIDDYEKWREEERKRIELEGLDKLDRGAKFQILPNHTFRQSGPAIVGVDVSAGFLKSGSQLMKADGVVITRLKSMKSGEDNVSEAKAGDQLAVALDGVTVGRQIHERDVLYVAISEEHFRKLKEFKDYLSKGEKIVLKEIAEIMRKNNPVWGV
ncbi:translation initiation factor IF-2 [Candidatus Woesearchaeota archaeon]|jgi:translation initiation factor 5B|nr:translation initiation factor IF-2 [Candidatus Woesearchaeota archaeon]MBT5272084.1 translation initiation factor IF-2 [Candidatus Woesearchaeota archaeon]MBT6041834.1 translation initiation factor IF-2 [Candidatus Woesearchaeota archaeon]MBT6336791.1 translation initiation factor IF-2 [Candidatus Woesearchaeota archaeon]MBT7927674.1 translation initiation factor IF-2 [Candidatus Woesearchaeota archaeon]